MANINDARAEAHYWTKRQLSFGLAAALDRIVARMVAIENRAGTNHVRPGFWTRSDGGAVGHVNDAGIDSESAKTFDGAVKTLFLLNGLLSDRTFKDFGRGKVREDAFE